MFRRGKRKGQTHDNPTLELRRRALHADPGEFGMEPTEQFPNVYGVVMDTTYASGVATLVVFADGTTSLYTSTGFGIIGGGRHAAVVREGRALLGAAEDVRTAFAPDQSDDPPPQGKVTIRLLTHDGRFA